MTLLARVTARSDVRTQRSPGGHGGRLSALRRSAGVEVARRRPWTSSTIGVTAFVVVAIGVVNPVAVLAAVGTGFFNIAGGGGAVISCVAVTAIGVPALTAHATGQFVTPASFTSALSSVRQRGPGWELPVMGCLGTAVGG